jgi:transposase
MTGSITFVGLDAHKKFIHVAVLVNQQITSEFQISNNQQNIRKLARKLMREARKNPNASGEVRVCYEAGCLGFGLKRQLESKSNLVCEVVAPSLIPVKPGERIKTDKRDARKLVKYFANGDLTEVHPPSEEEESVRDLCRCRDDVRDNLLRARHRLSKFLLRRPQYRYTPGRRHWTAVHLNWLRQLEFEYEADQWVFDAYLLEVEHCTERLKALDEKIELASKQGLYAEAVGWLRCFHGIDTLTAMVILSEIHDFRRFKAAPSLMHYLGLTPGEESSGDKHKRGPITKMGNKHVRRILTECAWHYRHPLSVGQALKRRRQGQPDAVINIANQAHSRLTRRYRRLQARGKNHNKIVTAIARELVGFVWSMMKLQEA